MSWLGAKERKWEWYKNTKPCYSLLNTNSCTNVNCNYAHTLEDYESAVKKRNFTIDLNIVNQFKRLLDDIDKPSSKRQRIY